MNRPEKLVTSLAIAAATVVFAWLPSAHAEAQAPAKKTTVALPTLIVFDMTPEKGVDPSIANMLTEIAIDRITKLGKYTVMGQKDLDKLLAWEQNKQMKGCTDSGCMVKIAGAMGASFITEGSVGAIGDQYIVTLKLIDTATVNVINRATDMVARDENTLVRSISKIVDTVLGQSAGAKQPLETQAHVEAAPSGVMTKAGMGCLFGGAGIVIIGGVFHGLAAKAASDANNPSSPQELNDLTNKVNTYDKVAITGYVVGGLAAAAGAVLWGYSALAKPADSKKTAVKVTISAQPVLDIGTAGVLFTGSW